MEELEVRLTVHILLCLHSDQFYIDFQVPFKTSHELASVPQRHVVERLPSMIAVDTVDRDPSRLPLVQIISESFWTNGA